MRLQARLLQTEQDRMITPEDDPEFYHMLRGAILLALKESDVLTEEQFQFASMQLENHE